MTFQIILLWKHLGSALVLNGGFSFFFSLSKISLCALHFFVIINQKKLLTRSPCAWYLNQHVWNISYMVITIKILLTLRRLKWCSFLYMRLVNSKKAFENLKHPWKNRDLHHDNKYTFLPCLSFAFVCLFRYFFVLLHVLLLLLVEI